jgi:hypothetical protein
MTHGGPQTPSCNAPQPIRDSQGAPIIGPANPAREVQSRDRLAA